MGFVTPAAETTFPPSTIPEPTLRPRNSLLRHNGNVQTRDLPDSGATHLVRDGRVVGVGLRVTVLRGSVVSEVLFPTSPGRDVRPLSLPGDSGFRRRQGGWCPDRPRWGRFRFVVVRQGCPVEGSDSGRVVPESRGCRRERKCPVVQGTTPGFGPCQESGRHSDYGGEGSSRTSGGTTGRGECRDCEQGSGRPTRLRRRAHAQCVRGQLRWRRHGRRSRLQGPLREMSSSPSVLPLPGRRTRVLWDWVRRTCVSTSDVGSRDGGLDPREDPDVRPDVVRTTPYREETAGREWEECPVRPGRETRACHRTLSQCPGRQDRLRPYGCQQRHVRPSRPTPVPSPSLDVGGRSTGVSQTDRKVGVQPETPVRGTSPDGDPTGRSGRSEG